MRRGPFGSCESGVLSGQPSSAGTNWAGNVVFGAAGVHSPRSVAELQALVSRGGALRPIGSRHSFNRIADTTGHLVSLTGLPPVLEVDRPSRIVRIGAGLRYGDLTDALHRASLALPNTGSLPHISVVGSCATGTHGSGTRNRILSAGVRSMTMVTAGGDIMTADRGSHGDDYSGVMLSLGRLGIVTELVLELVPAFEV
ncbi:MAG: FAD-binding protein, partial [Nocardioides sp.]